MRLQLNLASLAYRERRRVRLTLLALTLIVLSLLFWEGIGYRRVKLEEDGFAGRMERVLRQEEALAKEIRELGGQADEPSFKALRTEVGFVNDLISQKVFSWTQFLSDLEGRIPREIAIARIQPSFSTGLVRIGGTARSLKGLTNLMIALQSDPMFEEVFLIDQKVDMRGPVPDSVDFSIQFRYRRDRSVESPKGARDIGAAHKETEKKEEKESAG